MDWGNMAHIYKCTEWQSPTGRWYCNDVEDLGHGSGYWWIPCRILEMKPEDYILMLKNDFNAKGIKYNIETDTLFYFWDNKEDMRRYKNYINNIARKKNAMI